MSTDTDYLKETTARIMTRIRHYPHVQLRAGSRAAVAFYEVLQALTVLKAERPLLSAAMITLPHRVKSESVVAHERIIREIIESLNERGTTERRKVTEGLRSAHIVEILNELDRLQDVAYAMPYDVDILDADWFKFGQESLFRPEAPILMKLSTNNDKKADFGTYWEILDDLQQRGLIRLQTGGVRFTPLGTLVKYTNVFNYIARTYAQMFRGEATAVGPSGDIRKYRRGDRYRNLHVRRTLRSLVKSKKPIASVSKDDLRIREMSYEKQCLLVLALDHSWSMARSRKLQHAKDAAAGLIIAVKRSNDQAALIAFSDEASVLCPPTRRYGLLIEKVTQVKPENETNIADALTKIRTIFLSARGNVIGHAIVITDGIPTSEDQDLTRQDLEDTIFNELRKLKRLGITISIVCIRDELEENDTTLARKIASVGRGSFHMVNTTDLLDQVLRDYSQVKAKEP